MRVYSITLADDAVLRVLPDLTIRAASAASVEILAREADDLRGRPLIEATVDHRLELLAREALGGAIARGEIELRDLRPGHSDETRHVQVIAAPDGDDGAWILLRDLTEIKRLLEGIGLEVNILFGPESAGVAEWKRIPEAQFNLLLSPWLGLATVQHLEKKYGQPFLHLPAIPIGAKESRRFLERVSEFAGLDGARTAAWLIVASIAAVLGMIQWAKNALSRQMKAQVDAAIKSDRLKPNEAMKLLAKSLLATSLTL